MMHMFTRHIVQEAKFFAEALADARAKLQQADRRVGILEERLASLQQVRGALLCLCMTFWGSGWAAGAVPLKWHWQEALSLHACVVA